MKRTAIILLTALCAIIPAAARESRVDSLSLGFGLTESQGNFGLQGEMTSPRFADGIFALRARGGAEFASADMFAGSGRYWENFSSARIGLIAGDSPVSGALRLYGELGAAFLFAESLTGDLVTPGIYGLFGFEFYTDELLAESPVAYYVELGSTGIPAEADDLGEDMTFYNGFKIATGIRFYF